MCYYALTYALTFDFHVKQKQKSPQQKEMIEVEVIFTFFNYAVNTQVSCTEIFVYITSAYCKDLNTSKDEIKIL